MSQFLPDTFRLADIPVPLPESPPTQDQLRLQIQTIFSRPELIPEQFWAYATDYISSVGQPQIPISQVQGFAATQAITSSMIITEETTLSTTYVDLATVGPTLTGIPDGNYLVMFGCRAFNTTNVQGAWMSIQVDSTLAVDADAANVQDNVSSISVMMAVIKTLTAAPAGGHTITAKYRNSSTSAVATAHFAFRWLTAIKEGNV